MTHGVQENRRKRRQPHHAISSATPTAVERLCHSKRTWERGFHCATKQPSQSKHHQSRQSVCLPRAFWKRKRRRLRNMVFETTSSSFAFHASLSPSRRQCEMPQENPHTTSSAQELQLEARRREPDLIFGHHDSSQRWAVCICHVARNNPFCIDAYNRHRLTAIKRFLVRGVGQP